MTKPASTIEIAFDGTTFVDVTNKVRSFSIARGKSRELDEYRAGSCQVTFDNNTREFDPTNSLGPYFGNILPLRPVRIFANSEIQFVGTIDDWDLTYSPNGDNTAGITATDRLRIIANQVLPETINTVELSGDRVEAVLDLIDWPSGDRTVDEGAETLGADTIPANTNALAYLNLIAVSESGAFYMGKNGNAVFRDRRVVPSAVSPLLSDNGSGIPYTQLEIIFGSELLYNQVIYSNAITGNASTGNQIESQAIYDVQALQRQGILISTDQATQDITDFLANKYGQPAFRFESILLTLNNLSTSQQNTILELELGDVVQIIFTPGSPPTGSAINEYAEIIGINHSSDAAFHNVSLRFNTLNGTSLILDDVVFGRLNVNALAF
jgi:hypothetical protein